MNYTEVLYDCYGVTTAEGIQEYRIEASVESEGELPQKFIFVYLVNSIDDPTLDIFQRVGNPQDVQNLKVGRDAAIANDESEYLASYCFLQYATLDVAIQAKSELTTRINELVKYWIDYRDIFIIDNAVAKLFPTADPAYEQSLKDAYADARAVRIEKEGEVETANDDLETAKISAEQAADILPIYQLQKTFCDEIFGVGGALTNYYSNVSEYPDAAAYKAIIQSKSTTFCGNAAAGLATWTNEVASRNQQVSDAALAKGEAEAALTAAQKTEDEALAAVYAVCPDFDPSSV